MSGLPAAPATYQPVPRGFSFVSSEYPVSVRALPSQPNPLPAQLLENAALRSTALVPSTTSPAKGSPV